MEQVLLTGFLEFFKEQYGIELRRKEPGETGLTFKDVFGCSFLETEVYKNE